MYSELTFVKGCANLTAITEVQIMQLVTRPRCGRYSLEVTVQFVLFK